MGKNTNRRKGQKPHGTQEWSVKTVNCCTGCSHDCLYCYAKEMAIRFKQVQSGKWQIETIRGHDVKRRHKNYGGMVMFPSSHDITPTNLDACLVVLKNLLDAGNRALIVTKPHPDCINAICDAFACCRNVFELDEDGRRRYQILFRFTIGSNDNAILSYWEPNAPSYDERMAALKLAYDKGFQTSVRVEPMLDIVNADVLISQLFPYVTNAIWIGKMNHLGRLEKSRNAILVRAIETIRQNQTDSHIRALYQRHKNNPMIKWKKEIKKIVGIPLAQQNGLDI